MSTYAPAAVKLQVIALLNLAERDVSGVPSYTDALGDTTYATEELDRAVSSAGTAIMRAICETEGHPHRSLFTNPLALPNAQPLPVHVGPIGVPDITPYSGATYTIKGKVKSVDEVTAYRSNPNNFYSTVAHNASSGGIHSKLAGFYNLDNDVFHFTGFSAISDVANFEEAESALLPDSYHQDGIDLAIAALKKDGDVSDIFANAEARAQEALNRIRSQGFAQPSVQKTVGTRDSGTR